MNQQLPIHIEFMLQESNCQQLTPTDGGICSGIL
jgi:hypothetical protein